MKNNQSNHFISERDVLEIRPEAREKSKHYRSKARIGNIHMYDSAETSFLDLPTIAPYKGETPRFLVPFCQARSAVIHQAFIHFFIDDYRFECIWKQPERYLGLLARCQGVIGTDFSQLSDMPYPQRLYNCYRNRLLGHWMQKNGINYIHNVTWSLPDSYDYSFDGLPIGTIVAVNSNGIIGNYFSKYLWLKGYDEMLKRLKPSQIIRYGSKIDGENESISVYFQNERLNLLRNGR